MTKGGPQKVSHKLRDTPQGVPFPLRFLVDSLLSLSKELTCPHTHPTRCPSLCLGPAGHVTRVLNVECFIFLLCCLPLLFGFSNMLGRKHFIGRAIFEAFSKDFLFDIM